MKKDNKNIKKIVLEMILIPLCIIYLLYTLLLDNNKISEILCIMFTIITSLVFIIKYIKEVYIYENKYNVFKIIFSIYSIILVIISILTLILNINVLNLVFIIMIIILLIYLCLYIIKHIMDIHKNKGMFYKKIFSIFLSINSFVIILITLILSM